jgi:diguanylate cyclase (GGDEF)-like protein
MWILTVRSPGNEPVVFILKNGTNTVGRNQENDIAIVDDSISRQHAEIHCRGEKIVVRDLDSKNGTLVNLERINKPRPLRSGDQLHFGQRAAYIFQRNTSPLVGPIDDLSETKPRVRELSTEPLDKNTALLSEIASRLMSIPSLDGALKEISFLICEALDAKKCAVLQSTQFDQLAEMGFSTTLARQAIEQRSAVIFPDPSDRSRKPPSKSAELFHIQAALCVPFVIEDAVAGLLYAYRTDPNTRPFSPRDAKLAIAIGHQVSLAIQRARLIEETRVLKKWAITDSLTGLDNRRYTLELGELEFQRARSLKRPMSVLILDIDHFKGINDKYGHSTGDLVLKTVAGRFRQQLRGIDMLGRYGGDEFIVMLIDTGLEGAQAIGERLLLCISEVPFDTDRGAIPLTVSIGVSALTEDCPDLATLIDQADKVLYEAKQKGRNRVQAAQYS